MTGPEEARPPGWNVQPGQMLKPSPPPDAAAGRTEKQPRQGFTSM